jgi:hypothetical protein
VVKHGETYMTAALFWDVVTMFENCVALKQIIDIIQQRWHGVYANRAADFGRHTQQDVNITPWWEQPAPIGHGHKIFTDRRKLCSMLSAYFQVYLKPH